VNSIVGHKVLMEAFSTDMVYLQPLGLGGITGDERDPPATDGIVQFLRRQQLIQTYDNNHDVSLGDGGLDRATEICRWA
jgi:hypothetical protein